MFPNSLLLAMPSDALPYQAGAGLGTKRGGIRPAIARSKRHDVLSPQPRSTIRKMPSDHSMTHGDELWMLQHHIHANGQYKREYSITYSG